MARPRTIPKEDAIERALLLFWEQGYDRTSIADLSAALGVGPSSIYNAFGSKEELFRLSIERYAETYAAPTMELLGKASDLGAVPFARDLMRGLATLYTTKGTPLGCAIFRGAGTGPPSEGGAAAITQDLRTHLRTTLNQRFNEFAKAGERLSARPATLARFVLGTLYGLSELACDGASRADLMKVADHAARSCVE